MDLKQTLHFAYLNGAHFALVKTLHSLLWRYVHGCHSLLLIELAIFFLMCGILFIFIFQFYRKERLMSTHLIDYFEFISRIKIA